MPVSIEIDDENVSIDIFEKAFAYFEYIDEKFSPFKKNSELSQMNRGEIDEKKLSADMQEVLRLSAETKKLTNGFFDINDRDGKINTSGLVKGWAIYNATKIIREQGIKKFYVEAGGDIQAEGKSWKIGIKNPFDQNQIVKAVNIKNKGIATSGTYIRGQHVYNPFEKEKEILDVVSLTVIAPNIYEADRFATAAFVMGKGGIDFIEKLDGFEGYMIDCGGVATMTSGFEKYVGK